MRTKTNLYTMGDLSRILGYGSSCFGLKAVKSILSELAQVTGLEQIMLSKSKGVDLMETLFVFENATPGENYIYDCQDTPCCELLRGKDHYILSNNVTEHFPQDGWLTRKKILSYLSMKLDFDSNGTVGILTLMDTRTDRMPDPDWLELIRQRLEQELAQHLRHTEQEHQFHEQRSELMDTKRKLDYLSQIDPLCDVNSRSHFVKLTHREWSLACRHGGDLSVLLFDIDGFGGINRHYGHSYGDNLLKSFAERLKKSLRTTDIVGRFNSGQFAVILPQTPPEKAAELGERIKVSIETTPFVFLGQGTAITATVSSVGKDQTIENADHFLTDLEENLNSQKADKKQNVKWG